jgi:hypothetical protein
MEKEERELVNIINIHIISMNYPS